MVKESAINVPKEKASIDSITCLECRDLCATYGTLVALDSVSFHLKRGRVLGVLGPNGSGKTTLFRLILGLKHKSGGEIRIFDRPAGDRVALERIGAILESPSYYPHLSGRENLQITALLRGLPTDGLDQVLDDVGLLDVASNLCSTYSLGMRQRLAMALAILGDPELLILDEPTNGLDPDGVRWVRNWIRKRATEHGQTVVLASHMLAEVALVADDVLILKEGVSRYYGALEGLHEQGLSEIQIRVDDPEVAMRTLQVQGFVVRPFMERGVVRVEGSVANCPEIARLLLAEGLQLFELSAIRVSLEARYLELMES